MLVERDFLGGHGLDLDHVGLTGFADKALDNLVGLLGIACPVDDAAALGHLLFELDQQFAHAHGDVILECGAGVAKLLPVRGFINGVLALITNGGGGVVQVAALGSIVETHVSQRHEGLRAAQVAVAFGGARRSGVEEGSH